MTSARTVAKDVLFWSLPHSVRRSVVGLARPARRKELAGVRRRFFAPCDELGCIFVHIPKTAGISVGNALFGKAPSWHLSVRAYQLMYTRREYRRAFKFAFVRDPWARVVSAYDFLKKGGVEDHDRVWRDRHMHPDESFTDFILRWLTPDNAPTEIHFVPQSDFITRVPWTEPEVDFIGRFERIREDFDYVCRRLGVHAELPHVNRSAADRPRGYAPRFDAASAQRVAEVYAKDIERFGYRFEEGP